ncbi:Uncharacterised protein [Escherichia coli]|nr:Uncharacterised protein [Escherichia coli]
MRRAGVGSLQVINYPLRLVPVLFRALFAFCCRFGTGFCLAGQRCSFTEFIDRFLDYLIGILDGLLCAGGILVGFRGQLFSFLHITRDFFCILLYFPGERFCILAGLFSSGGVLSCFFCALLRLLRQLFEFLQGFRAQVNIGCAQKIIQRTIR